MKAEIGRAMLSASLLVALSLPSRAQLPGDLTLSSVLEGTSVSVPLALRHAGDGSGRTFVVERAGVIRIHVPGSGLLATPFLDIALKVDTFFEGGLQGLAFHPDYATNGFFYVYYTADPMNDNNLVSVVERYRVSEDPDVADGGSAEEIFTLSQPAGNHNGGDLHFGPDGYLYIGLGDGGGVGAGDNGQDLTTLLGKMLRIDPCDTESCTTGYQVPPGNPYAISRGTIPPEIWGVGLRNPYRWSFDRLTGDMFIADVGAQTREEVSFQPAGVGGLNYGWDCREGDIPGPGNCTGSFSEPIVTVSSSSGPHCSITGGFRYRGCIEGLRDLYVFSDYCSGQIFFSTEDSPGSWSTQTPAAFDLPTNVFGFGEDEDGELYVLTADDIQRFESESACVVLFGDGFELGDTSRWSGVLP